MIDFFFKRKEITLDCFTFDSSVYEYAKIKPAVSSLPLWFKCVPKTYQVPNEFVGHTNEATIRSCYGILEHFKQSFVMPLWGDLIVTSSPDGFGFQFAKNGYSEVNQHHPEQTNCTFVKHYEHLKFKPPWVFRCNKDINFLLVAPFWYDCVDPYKMNNFIVQHGVVNFKNGMSPSVNVFIPKNNFRLELHHNEPFMQFFPLSDKKIKIVNHLVTQEDYKKTIIPPPNTFLNSVLKVKRIDKND